MKTKIAALAATMLAAFGVAAPAAAAINAPVPMANYIVFGGNDWAWASPCPATGTGCGNGAPVDFSFQGGQGWRLPTALELAAGPAVTDFGSANMFKCASAWFTSGYSHCDYGDAAGGAVYGAPRGNVWFAETWVIRPGAEPAVPEPATWAMLIGGFAMAGAVMRRRSTVAFAA